MSQISKLRPKGIVLLTWDCLLSNAGVARLIHHFHDQISLIGLSTGTGGKRGSFLQQAWKNFHRSGPEFLIYLGIAFPLYPSLLRLHRILHPKAQARTIRDWAASYDIPVAGVSDVNAPESLELLTKHQPDLIISAYFDQIIRRPVLRIPSLGVINIHGSFLPRCRGPFPVIGSVLQEASGATVHFIEDETLDTGPILKQASYRADPGKSLLMMNSEIWDLGARLAIECLEHWEQVQAVPQSGPGTYYRYPSKKDLARLREEGYSLISPGDLGKLFS